jgi:hypothetical protein
VWWAFAALMALSHASLLVLLVFGALFALRWRWLVWLHLPAAVLTAIVFSLGADCPLTTWQKYGIRRSGREPYEGGFIEHYLVEPLTGRPIPSYSSTVILLVWVVPTAVGYGLMIGRYARTRRAQR